VRPLRIALLTHSTNPRGGVVHFLELAAALERLGHAVTLHAPSIEGARFAREPACDVALIPAVPGPPSVAALVTLRSSEFARWFAKHPPDFDVYHAGDGLGANALADLVEGGAIEGFARTVHHLDDFVDPVARDAQRRSIDMATELLCVSELWRARLAADFGRTATRLRNGVDLQRFHPGFVAADAGELARLGLARNRPFVLAVGGFEPRKNTLRLVEAFAYARSREPDLSLVVAGGASVLDHQTYAAAVGARIAELGVEDAVRVTGPVSDGALEALYRGARSLVFPSLVEGFGLAVLEALACGTPPIVARRQPFLDYVPSGGAIFVDPENPMEIAAAIAALRDERIAARIVTAGVSVLSTHTWRETARGCEPVYARLSNGALTCLK